MVAGGVWSLDPDRSTIGFVASHVMGLGRVRGRFTRFSGEVSAAPGALPTASVRIEAASIETGSRRRDDDLRSPTFLAVEEHPEIRYVAERIEPEGEGRHRLLGTITVKGIDLELPLSAKAVDSSSPDDVLRARALATFDRRHVGVRPGAKALVVGRLVGVEIQIVANRAG